MKNKLTKTCLIAVTSTCVLSALVQQAAAESYWCKMFPKFCSDEGTPGGTQNAPEAPAPADTMTPSAAPAAPSTEAAPPPPPPPAPPASPAPASPTP
jgi:hypothetical protein